MRREPSSEGFTIVELLVVMLLLLVVGSVVVSGLVSSMTATRESQQRIETMAELQRGAENITRELRAACPVEHVQLRDANGQEELTVRVRRGDERYQHRYVVTASGQLVHDVLRHDGNNWVAVSTGTVRLRGLVNDGTPVFGYRNATAEMSSVTAANYDTIRAITLTLRRSIPNQDHEIEVTTLAQLRNGGSSCH